MIIQMDYRQRVESYRPSSLEDRFEAFESDQESSFDDLAVEFLLALDRGDVRAASNSAGSWSSHAWVKRAILHLFDRAENVHRGPDRTATDVLPVRETESLPERGARITPGATVRAGTHIGANVTIMGGAYVNIGTFIADDSMVDSNVTVGSCAQIGAGTHIGANTLIGGVLEPVEETPVVIGDAVSIGGGSIITSGFEIGSHSAIAERTLLTPRIEVFDLVEEETLRGRIPADRRVFQRYVASSVGDLPFFDDVPGVMKPAVVAIGQDESPIELEDRLRVGS